MKRLSLFILFLLSLSGTHSLQAQEGSASESERLQFLKSSLEKDRKKAVLWQNSWLAGYSLATVAQGIVFFSSDELSVRQDMALGAATTLMGAVGAVIMPAAPSESYYRHRANDSIAAGNEENYLALRLSDIAVREIAGRSWKNHALTGAVNLASGLITWKAFHRSFTDGLINFALNTAITEAQIWTQPVGAIRDLGTYGNYQKQAYCHFSLYPSGIALRVDF